MGYRRDALVRGTGDDAGRGRFEFLEQAIEVLHVEDQAHALGDGHQARTPHFIEGATLDADIGHGLGIGEPASCG